MRSSVAPVFGLILVTTASVLTPRAVNCVDDPKYELSIKNWNRAKADDSLRAFWHGGEDAEGVKWPGAKSYGEALEFTTILGRRLQDKGTFSCSGLGSENDCVVERCTRIGKRNKKGERVGDPSRWGLLALHSVSNLHEWLTLLYGAIESGKGDADPVALRVATDFVEPAKQPPFGIAGALPAAKWSPFAAGTNALQSLIGTQIALNLKGPTAAENFQTADSFARAIALFADQTRQSLDVANDKILNSDNDFTLNILSGGQWINKPDVTRTAVATFYRKNMIARGINAIWRSYPVYIHYTWLDDAGAKSTVKNTKCDHDRSGPQSAKYCADEGVYYLYMYNGRGIDWPYGGPSLESGYGINPVFAIESSVRSYKAGGIDYDASKSDPANFLGATDIAEYLDSPERLEGTWTIPVCDGSSHISQQFDYENARSVDLKNGVGIPPCACGIDGRDTATFIKAANFASKGMTPKKIARSCFNYWTVTGLAEWPAGADQIVYGEGKNEFITKGAIEGCRRASGKSNPDSCDKIN
ncbi:MAG: hypothetical protein Q9174_004144 [Haloplaca sp. 1 TL-2023]